MNPYHVENIILEFEDRCIFVHLVQNPCGTWPTPECRMGASWGSPPLGTPWFLCNSSMWLMTHFPEELGIGSNSICGRNTDPGKGMKFGLSLRFFIRNCILFLLRSGDELIVVFVWYSYQFISCPMAFICFLSEWTH